MIEYEVYPLSDLLSADKADIDVEKLKVSMSSFKCRREVDMETFLSSKAITYDNSAIGRTFLIVDKYELDKGNFVIAGFYTIAITTVNIEALSANQKKKLLGNIPNRNSLKNAPALLIGQIGRNDNYSHDDLPGVVILNECYSDLRRAQQITGGRILILECRKETFEKFYSHQGFKKFYDTSDDHSLYTVYKNFKPN
ncbi:hypothetical protein AWM75_08330 [Aerococcus urinaehominis]|uniref:Uncharacterized protein n=1 Tax=Aerococcus urinaehominis TaxID=128944 RepID=A0A0X8FMC6_9LACT|nr:hypothetical protein [Aerococcus urinaehominis]AMB99976.1 hypothetical protein AWM75_08330 [Aerococcus urinaehominis]SDM45369.1 hypothetical protein SAMN04487985_11728 [Aerococcus urinaehominis]